MVNFPKLVFRGFETLIVLFAFYFLSFWALSYWVNASPQQASKLIGEFTDTEFSYEFIDITPHFSSIDVDIKGLKVHSSELAFSADDLAFDIDFLSLMLPGESVGKSISVQSALMTLNNRENSKRSYDFQTVLFDPDANLLLGVTQVWQKSNLEQIDITLDQTEQVHPTRLTIHHFKSMNLEQLSLQGELSVYQENFLADERIRLDGVLNKNELGSIRSGQLELNNLDTISLANIKTFLPSSWQAVLPNGEIEIDAQLFIKDAYLSQLDLRTKLSSLDWPQLQENLPNSMGVEFKWNWSKHSDTSAKKSSDFLLSNIQINEQFVEDVSPLSISIAENKLISFESEKFDLEPFKVIMNALARHPKLADFFNQTVEMNLVNLKGQLDWVNYELPYLQFHLKKMALPLSQYPSIATTNLSFLKQDENIVVTTPDKVWMLSPTLSAKPFSILLPNEWSVFSFDDAMLIEDFSFKIKDMSVSVSAELDNVSNLNAMVALKSESIKPLQTLLPYSEMSPKLQWLLSEGLVDASSVDINAVVDLNLRDMSLASALKGIEAEASMQNIILKFDQAWPAIQNLDLGIQLDKAELKFFPSLVELAPNVKTDKIHVSISDLSKKDIGLSIQTEVETSIEDAVAYLKQTPLIEKAGLDEFLSDSDRLVGNAHIWLDSIFIPLSGFENKTEQVTGRVDLSQAHLSFSEDLGLSDISGQIEFSEKRVQSSWLKGEFLQGPVDVVLDWQGKNSDFNVDLKGLLLDKPNPFIKEALPWSSNVKVNSAGKVTLKADIDTQKLQSKLPQPFDSQNLNKAPINLDLAIEKGVLSGEVLQDKVFEVSFMMDDLEAAKLSKMQFSYKTNLNPDSVSGYEVQANLDQFDVSAWQAWWEQNTEHLEAFAQNSDGQAPWLPSEVVIANLQFQGQDLGETRLSWYLDDEQHRMVTFKNALTEWNWRSSPENLLNTLKVNKLFWQSAKQKVDKELEREKVCSVDPLIQSEWHIHASNLGIDGYFLDQLEMYLMPNSQGYESKGLKGNLANQAGDFKGRYKYNRPDHTSQLSLALQSRNTKALNKFMKIDKGLSKGKAQVDLDLNWLGGLECFDIFDTRGQVAFKFEDGLIEDAEPGIGRLLGLLSVESIARRLTLNLKDLTSKGLIYDEINGRVVLNEGLLRLKDFRLKAPSVDIRMSGDIDLKNEVFNLNARVVPAIGSSLPTVAALAGAANPLAALAIYTFMKVVPKLNEELITYKYDITGDFKEPKIQLVSQKILEN